MRKHLFAAFASVFALGASLAATPNAGAAEAPITIVINTSPWLAGFTKIVDQYKTETGNQVTIDALPTAGLAEKERSGIRSAEAPFDIMGMQAGLLPEFYFGGYMKPLSEIDPAFKLDPNVITFDNTTFWDPEKKRIGEGALMAVPLNPNVSLMYYRKDIYDENGLKVPQTFDELLANAKTLNQPPKQYGFTGVGARGLLDNSAQFLPILWGFGGDVFKDQNNGDYSVTIANEQSVKALKYFVDLLVGAGHPKAGGQNQASVIQNLVTGKSANAIIVVSAWSQMDDPNKSVVPDKIAYAPVPHADGYPSTSILGHWLAGVPKNIPAERQKAALAFLKWFQTKDVQAAFAEAGSPPVRSDVLTSSLADEPKFRWMRPLAESLKTARLPFRFPESAQVIAIMELRLNQALVGDLTPEDAAKQMEIEITDVMQRAGYKTKS
jgi:multiple sugar transport system substrate-binding protein